MPKFNDEDRESSTDDDWDASSAEEEEKKPVAGEFHFFRLWRLFPFLPLLYHWDCEFVALAEFLLILCQFLFSSDRIIDLLIIGPFRLRSHWALNLEFSPDNWTFFQMTVEPNGGAIIEFELYNLR